MAIRGDAVTTTLTFLSSRIDEQIDDTVFLSPNTVDCCYELPVFGSQSDSDSLKNDVTRFLRGYEESITLVNLFLTKPSDSSFSEISLIDNSYGEFFPLGFHTDELLRNYVGYKVDWRTVLAAHGEGTYQIRADKTGILPNLPSDYDFRYCAGNFSAQRANMTIRFSFSNSYILGDRFDVRKRVYFPENWNNQLRVEGFFGGDNSTYEKTFTKYRDESLRTVQDRQVEKYFMRVNQAPSLVHNYIKTEILQADDITITDYNQNNPNRHIETPVREPEGYEPAYREDSLLANVDVSLTSRFDNKLKKHC